MKQLMVDDKFDKIAWHKGLIEGGMDTNHLLLRLVDAQAHGVWPHPTAPAAPTDRDLGALGEICGAQLPHDGLEVMAMSH
jgi:hypothetical protein